MSRMPTDRALEAQIVAARERGKAAATAPHRVVAARHEHGRIIVEFANGFTFGFPPASVPGLEDQPGNVLDDIEVDPLGEGIRWDAADIDVSVPGLLVEALGAKELFRFLGRLGGKATTNAKREAARSNGQKGGRPAGMPTSQLEWGYKSLTTKAGAASNVRRASKTSRSHDDTPSAKRAARHAGTPAAKKV